MSLVRSAVCTIEGTQPWRTLLRDPGKGGRSFCFRALLGTSVFLSQQALPAIILQLLQFAVFSVLLSCSPCFPPSISSYSDISLEWVQSILLSKLRATVGLVMKSSSVKGRKKPTSSGSPKCFLTYSKYSELFSYYGCSCAPQPKSKPDITCNRVCNPQMPLQVCIL